MSGTLTPEHSSPSRVFRLHGIGRTIQAKRREKGLSQDAVAGPAGVAPSTVSAIERGHLPVTLTTLRDIVRFIGADWPAIRAELAANLTALRFVRPHLAHALEQELAHEQAASDREVA